MLTIQIERKTNEFETSTTSSLEVELENHTPSIVVVRVSGEADPGQADYLARQLEAATKQAPRFVILDLARLNFLSSAALGCLEEFRREQCWRGSEVWPSLRNSKGISIFRGSMVEPPFVQIAV